MIRIEGIIYETNDRAKAVEEFMCNYNYGIFANHHGVILGDDLLIPALSLTIKIERLKGFMAYNHNDTPLMQSLGTYEKARNEADEYSMMTGNGSIVKPLFGGDHV